MPEDIAYNVWSNREIWLVSLGVVEVFKLPALRKAELEGWPATQEPEKEC